MLLRISPRTTNRTKVMGHLGEAPAAPRRRGRRTNRPRPLLESLEARTLLTATAVADSYRLIEGVPFSAAGTGGVLANDVIASGNALSVSAHTSPSHGSLAIQPDGTFTYTPNAGYAGADSFTYTANDGLGHTAIGTVGLTIAGKQDLAAVTAGPRLASVSTSQSALLNGLIGGLVGVNLTAVDWNSIAGGDVRLGSLLDTLRANLSLSDTSQVLSADLTLGQVLSAAATAAQADGETALVTGLNGLIAQVPGLTQTIKLGDLLQVDPNQGSLANIGINALDLVTGAAQLYNFKNVATTPSPVTISGSSLGLGSLINSVQLYAQVIEPPVFVRAAEGVTFHTAAVRTELALDLVDINLDTTSLASGLLSSLGLVGATVTAGASLGQLDVYAEVASGTGVLSSVDAIAGAVTVQATPGLANLYVGDIAPSVFFNRTHAINPATDVGYGSVGGLNLAVNSALLGNLANVSVGIQARSSALGTAPLGGGLTFNGPFPETQTVGSGAAAVSNLVTTLVTNLQLQLSGALGALLSPATSTILSTLKPVVGDAVGPVLSSALTNVADPLLQGLGIGIGQMVVTVQGIGYSPPQANADFYQTNQGVPATLAVLDNDAVEAGDNPAVVAVTQPSHGTASIRPDGSILYTPSPNYFGPDSFTYTLADSAGLTSTATVTLTVKAVNLAPAANNDSYTVGENASLAVNAALGVLANDTQNNNLPLSAVLVSGPSHGTLSLNGDGSFTYTPAANYYGPDGFTYRATASGGALVSNVATVNLTVGRVDLPPVAGDDSYATTRNTPIVRDAALGVLANDSQNNNLPLSAVLISGPSHGLLVLNPNGSFVYTPAPNYSGADSFTYQATAAGGTLLSNVATVSFTIGHVNLPPTAINDFYAVASNATLSVNSASGVLANDTEPDGLTLSAVLETGPSHGTLTLNNDGSFTYTPAAGYVGLDSFSYHATAGAGLDSNVATVTLTITPSAPNLPPVALGDLFGVNENSSLNVTAPGVLGNDTDVASLPLSAVLVSGPSHGTLSLNSDGSFAYTPNANYFGVDGFTYQATDGTLQSNVAAVVINVNRVDQAPVANNDAYVVNENATLAVVGPGVLANDTQNNNLPLSAVLVTNPSHGSLSLNADGSFTYTPAANYYGPDSFSYRATAAAGALVSGTATVNLTVNRVDLPPVAVGDSFSVNENASLTISAPGVLANDTQNNGLPLGAVLVSGPSHGTLSLNSNGSFTYTPAANYFGADSFTYQATAAGGTMISNVATVNVSVNQVDLAPVANNDAYAVGENQSLTVPFVTGVLANDAQNNNLPLSAVLVTNPSHGSLSLNADGSFTYTPAAGYFGADSFTYRATASGGSLSSNVATVNLTVGRVDLPPVAANDAYSVSEGAGLTASAGAGVLANDAQNNNLPLSAVLVSGPSHGTLSLNSDGSFTYTPAAGYFGSDGFTYRATASGGSLVSNTATVSISVARVDLPPVANGDSYAVNQNGTLSVLSGTGVLANDTQNNGLPLSATLVTPPSHGTLALNADGSFTYTPAAGYVGQDTFTYRATASGGSLSSSPASVTVTVVQAAMPPVGVGDVYSTTYNQRIVVPGTIGVLANDVNNSGTPLRADLVSGPSHGSLTLNADGSFIYTPINFGGTDQFTYRVTDGLGRSSLATASIDVKDNGPIVTQMVRYGCKPKWAEWMLTFDRPMDPASVANPANYQLLVATRGKTFAPRTFKAVKLIKAVYDPVNHTVRLYPKGPQVARKYYQMTAFGSGLTDTSGVHLDGDANGVAGGNYVHRFGFEAFVGQDPWTMGETTRAASLVASADVKVGHKAKAVHHPKRHPVNHQKAKANPCAPAASAPANVAAVDHVLAGGLG
ncbi:hypothetical protein OJF2_04960 [Aquisphaera giovannonii]|uniref:RapA2 cadherin-like domain-containing protein n=1 Tax=Aquisphaera giovannonii TaxID=406548 RepID=A0A5B9VVR2_9BACT|nr:Ig-like domain-containing protein [Aquisphaera giovannonii]QEH32027.1 hypothetical protein OJF2_04960 [Aquisphaera giovannonii]